MKQDYMPFSSIKDLLNKAEKIKVFHQTNISNMKSILKDNKIKFETVGDFGITIDSSTIGGSDLESLFSPYHNGLNRLGEEVGFLSHEQFVTFAEKARLYDELQNK